MDYANQVLEGEVRGEICSADGRAAIRYHGQVADQCFHPCVKGSLDEWLMERYTAFTHVAGKAGFFRVWHRPWPQVRASATVTDQGLLGANWPFLRGARIVGAHFSPGVFNVWMGWPHRLPQAICAGGDS